MLKKTSLAMKMVGGFVIVAVICGIVAFIGIRQMRRVEAGGAFLYNKVAQPLVNIAEVSTHFHRMRGNTMEYLDAKTSEARAEQKKRIEARRGDMMKNLDAFGKGITTDAARATHKELVENLKTYASVQEKVFGLMAAGKTAEAVATLKVEGDKARGAAQTGIETLAKGMEDQARKTAEENKDTAAAATTILTALLVLGVGSSLGIGIFLSRSTSVALHRTAGALSEGATQVASASGQLSSSSQGLAEGSSEQAASLEETASAMEEMSAMTRRNAESAGQAKSLADRAGMSVEKSNASMRSLVTSMAEISSMGEETGKIVKTIDEIAFQTNLLALNAAVEAARAGEAGAGFAVVADEVRNLAQRAAGAAKNTSELIEGTIKKIQDGTVLVEKTNADFAEVASGVAKVTELVAEISAASSEQSRGIDEVSRAIGQMDKVTQGNAANAEEIASASEELSAQAGSMEEVVRGLRSLVEGEGSGAVRTAAAEGAPASRRKPALPARAAKPSPGKAVRAAIGIGKRAIPLEEKAMA